MEQELEEERRRVREGEGREGGRRREKGIRKEEGGWGRFETEGRKGAGKWNEGKAEMQKRG